MKKSQLKKLIKEVVSESFNKPNDMRFDIGGARIECWVMADDITAGDYADQYRTIVADKNVSIQDKIKRLKIIALEVAQAKIREAEKSVGEITADVTIQDVNVDRIDWQELASPQQEKEEI